MIREVPADRLLVWQVKEGWGPLCQVVFKIERLLTCVQIRSVVKLCSLIKHLLKVERKNIWCCQQFLGVPVPDEPFPNVNDTPTMLERIR